MDPHGELGGFAAVTEEGHTPEPEKMGSKAFDDAKNKQQ